MSQPIFFRKFSYLVAAILIVVALVMTVLMNQEGAESTSSEKLEPVKISQRRAYLAAGGRVLREPVNRQGVSEQVLAQVSVERVVREAREELRVFEGQAEKQEDKIAWREKLQQVQDAAERHQLMMERRERELARRQEYEASLTEQDKGRRSRLKMIVELDQMLRLAQRVAWNEELRFLSDQQMADISSFAAHQDQLAQEEFQRQWSELKAANQQLVMKTQELRNQARMTLIDQER